MNFFLRYNGIFLNAFIAIFILFFRNWLFEIAYSVMFNQAQSVIFPIIIGLAIIADLYGVNWKLKFIKEKDKTGRIYKLDTSLFFIWFGRAILQMILAMFIISSLGGSATDLNALGTILIVGLVAKELYILVKLYEIFQHKVDPKKLTKKKEFHANLALWFSITIFYTVIWETLLANSSIVSWPDFIAGFILFCMLILPMHMVYLIEDVVTVDTNKERAMWIFSFIITVLVAFLPAI
ncbi:hypothetical protein HOH67_03185 [Candidatus Peregrinibacteria bacterium]|jgi:hypothetical protein|nr:hypothetical protein [Candidatus Peregrinibacteria bacterium]MBT5824105.1 hypothetical protein [Candidatus Peregrinibacteria bacterium]